ncbi:nitroreductase family protein [Ottowia sp.]|uniref:nitroreductase family protein n=1 Tax=Ottowia sp. TaxID=1898956 RepID=UPI003A85E11B
MSHTVAAHTISELAELVSQIIHTRQTVLPRRLGDPGPSGEQLAAIVGAAAAAPDHQQLLPWRFVQVPASARAALGQAFALALQQRDAAATPEQLAQAREKAARAPLLLLAVVRLHDDKADAEAIYSADVPPHERIVSAGCAIQNVLLMAHAMGFGAALTSGKALQSEPLRTLFGLSANEQALAFISMGTVVRTKPPRVRPETAQFLTVLGY